MKKEPTLEEWKKIGAKSKDIRDNLIELAELLSGKLPLYQYENKWKSADAAFGKLRSHLDDLVLERFTDHPDQEINHVFYGMDEKK